MIENRHTSVGLDRLVRLDCLEKVASLVDDNYNYDTIKSILQVDLQKFFRSANTSVRGSIDKTITILLKVWLRVPRNLEHLRMEGLELLNQLPLQEHLAIHWGMVSAIYPFWSGVATQVGRLLRLQNSVAASHVQRRVRELYGDRETVSRRTRYVMRSFLDWGVLNETSIKGIYSSGLTIPISNPHLIAWLLEVLLHARCSNSASIRELLESPSLFPLQINQIQVDKIRTVSSRLEVLLNGQNEEFIYITNK